jgi:hypothetical protein
MTSPPELIARSFEVIFETPHAGPLAKQSEAFVVAIREIMLEY